MFKVGGTVMSMRAGGMFGSMIVCSVVSVGGRVDSVDGSEVVSSIVVLDVDDGDNTGGDRWFVSVISVG